MLNSISSKKTNGKILYRTLLVSVIYIAVISCTDRVAVQKHQPFNYKSIEYYNLADDYLKFYDETQGLEITERVKVFEQDIVSKFEDFYGFDRYRDYATKAEVNKKYAREINNFGDIRAEYSKRLTLFDAQLKQNIRTFSAVFSDYQPSVPIYLVHSLGEFDGGTREFNGQSYLLFGMDLIVKYHDWPNDAPFFHHELFHTYHDQYFSGCNQLWCSLWVEGLATYVSRYLNPQASHEEMLLDIPKDLVSKTEERILDAWLHLESVLTSKDQDIIGALFNFKKDDSGLPIRRGYYLGYLIAAEAVRTHELKSLVTMNIEAAYPLVLRTTQALKDKACKNSGQHKPCKSLVKEP